MSLFSPLRQAAVAFFKHDVALRREPGGVQIVLEERGPGGQRLPSRAELARKQEKLEVALMLEQLDGLLSDMPETRQTMRHLVFVEQSLAKKGLKALHKLPLNVLQHALAQLEGLVTNWSPVGLANLRSKMAVAIIDRDHLDHDAEADVYRTAAVLDVPLPPPAVCAPESALGPSDDDALAAAYAALGAVAPGAVETQSELGSPSARSVNQQPPRQSELGGEIKLRELNTT
jgi:hypothetical protein